jgi:hypothetical protein
MEPRERPRMEASALSGMVPSWVSSAGVHWGFPRGDQVPASTCFRIAAVAIACAAWRLITGRDGIACGVEGGEDPSGEGGAVLAGGSDVPPLLGAGEAEDDNGLGNFIQKSGEKRVEA